MSRDLRCAGVVILSVAKDLVFRATLRFLSRRRGIGMTIPGGYCEDPLATAHWRHHGFLLSGEKQKRKVGASKSGKPVERAKAEDFFGIGLEW